MVSFDDFKATDDSPLYVQILRHIRHEPMESGLRSMALPGIPAFCRAPFLHDWGTDTSTREKAACPAAFSVFFSNPRQYPHPFSV